MEYVWKFLGNFKMEPKLVSSLGIKYPARRGHPLHGGDIWLNEKSADEGAEGLWRIHDGLYDLTELISSHPGGSEWIRMTKGTDITEAFELHHLSHTPEQLLPNFFKRKANTQRNYPFTFHDDGFYKTLKRRILPEIDKMPRRYVIQSEMIADTFFAAYMVTAYLAIYTGSLSLCFLSGVILSYLGVIAHNFVHQKDNFRMYYLDLTLLSSREWRISHALSHHMYTNTVNDLEISQLEPWFYWLPFKKHSLMKYIQWVYAPIVYSLIFYGLWIKTLITNIRVRGTVPLLTFLPFVIPIFSYVTTDRSFSQCMLMFLFITLSSSLHFGFVGFNAAHHHPDIFHDGDTIRPKEEMDFGVFQLDTVTDRKDINRSPLLVLTHFGDHALHHLFPTIDHGLLPFLYPVFKETCEEFGLEWRCTSQMDLIKGQFLQLTRDINQKAPKKLKILKWN
ncbi:hypothetical protein WA026_000243 [Henosepilachna vigintioctopunctata]|uniref:Cytochrome b5 heme-binding domain-containing protein n=1 Tax=Henosepilachna vigintioctopunctata TaxID=420089 RepID=A0AAW1V559_9CUCU